MVNAAPCLTEGASVVMGERFGLYGGTFDPIHHGHLIVARSVAEQLHLARVILLPSATPPHKNEEGILAAAHREAMVRLATGDEPLLDCGDFDLRRPGPSFTIETIEHYRKSLGVDAEICWIVGADSLAELATWHRIGELVDLCRIVTAGRPGWDEPPRAKLRDTLNDKQIDRLLSDILPTPMIDISSTEIRRRIGEGRSIRFLVPESVRVYIETHGLYRAKA